MSTYYFPFNEVNKNTKIIIYGGGMVGRQYLDQLMCLGYCEVLFVVDRNYKEIQWIAGIEVRPPEHLAANIEYDKIVIASKNFGEDIRNILHTFSVPDENIVHQIVTSSAIADESYVSIKDYSYTPKYRTSLKFSSIGKLMEEWYNRNKEEIFHLVKRFCSFEKKFETIPLETPSIGILKWVNGAIPPFDAISIYGFLATKNPRYYVEVGSGNTTLFAARSIHDNDLRTKIISIDPHPRVGIDELCYKTFRVPFEDMELDFFTSLSADDILLLDNSHRSFPNSDVTVFFTEILPMLPTGILYAMHDIFLPSDYPEKWSADEKRWYNEQYLLCAYLLGGADGDRIICPNGFLGSKSDIFEACGSLWGKGGYLEGQRFGGGFFWIEKS